MSIQSEIERINGNVASAYTALSAKGATMPSLRNTANLASAIESIQAGEAMSIDVIREICGWVDTGLPKGYVLLNYLQGTGSAYINLGFNPNQKSRIVVDTEAVATSSHSSPFGSRTASSAQFFAFMYNGSATSPWQGRWGPTNYGGAVRPNVGRSTLDLSANGFSVNGETVAVNSATFSINYPVYLFGDNNTGNFEYPYYGKIYACQLYDNGTLVRDCVPCINPSGMYGMYDKVNGQFYGSSGSGSLNGA